MSKLVATINAATKKANVIIDNNAAIDCPIKREGNGSWTIVLKGKVEFPRNYITFTKKDEQLEDYDGQTIERDSSQLKVVSTTTAATHAKKQTETEQYIVLLERVAGFVKKYGFDIDEMVTEIKEQCSKNIAKEKALAEVNKIDAQIEKLLELKKKALGKNIDDALDDEDVIE